MNVAIFCSSNDLDDKYTRPAKQLAKLLGTAGHAMVYGGSDYGLMKAMADEVQRTGGRVIGITVPIFSKNARKNADEMIIAKTLGERKAGMLERAGVIAVLPGGLGTLDEATEVLELKKQNHHDKPVIILNTAGFYDGLKFQLKRMSDEGFLKMNERNGIKSKTLDQFVSFVDTPEEVVQLLS